MAQSKAGPARPARPIGAGPGPLSARVATEGELNRTARGLIRKAEDAGWYVAATYARGEWESLALRMWRAGTRAVALFQDGRFSSAYTWSATDPIRKVGARELARGLTSDAV